MEEKTKMTILLLFLYFAKANALIVPEWMMSLTWALTAGDWLIRLLAALGKAKKKG